MSETLIQITEEHKNTHATLKAGAMVRIQTSIDNGATWVSYKEYKVKTGNQANFNYKYSETLETIQA